MEIIDAGPDNIHKFGMCGYKNIKNEGYRRKIEWLKNEFSNGMKYKILYSDQDGAVGGIEYIPGEYSWRTVEAPGYMVIHCIYILPRKYKGIGYGALLLKECLADAKKKKLNGVAVVTRKGSFMAGRELFVKNDFDVVDKAAPDFELLVKKIKKKPPSPRFKPWEKRLGDYEKGLTIFKSDQCPYAVKSVQDISEIARKDFSLAPRIIELKNSGDAQNSPCPFGAFCIVFNGNVIADHPISKRRFSNIINKISPA